MSKSTVVLTVIAAIAGFTLCGASAFAQVSIGPFPNMQNVSVPSPEPALPGSFDTFAPPVSSVSPAANTPTFAEWIRTGAPDDTIAATGDLLSSYTGTDLGKDTSFLVFGQTTGTNSMLIPAKIQRSDALRATFTIDSTMPTWSMYMVWPRNSVGYGAPIAVNKTESWWVGPKKAERGATTAVFGRNLSHNNGTTDSWVYVKNDSNLLEPATVTSVNPYRVAFTVPSDLSDGNHEVWIHNGHGGHYGWSGPLTLQVYTRHAWSGPIINVKTAYNAMGDGSTNDTSAVAAAFAAAATTPYSTVYFPAGNYMVNAPIPNAIPSNTKVLGDGSGSSAIKMISGGSTFISMTSARSNIEIDNICIDGNTTSVIHNSRALIDMESCSDIWFNNAQIKSLGQGPFYFIVNTGIYLSNCEIDHGPGGFFNQPTQIFFDHCAFKAANDAEGALGGWGIWDISITNCTSSDYDNTQSWGWGEGRFYCPGGWNRESHNSYLGNNTTFDLTPQPSADQNSGEQMLWEDGRPHWQGTVASADATHATFATAVSGASNNDAIIVAGKGIGQHRRIASSSGNTITLATPWNVIPDSTSSIVFETAFERVVVYQNYIDAKDSATVIDGIGQGTSSVGVDPDGGCYDFVIDGNTFHQTRFGMRLAAEAIGYVEPNFFNLFVNNTCDSTRYPIDVLVAYNNDVNDPVNRITNPPVETSYLCNIFRKNSVINTVLTGNSFPAAVCVIGSWPWAGPSIDMLVFEHNNINGTGIGIDTSGSYAGGVSTIGNLIVYKNTFARGSVAGYSGSKGVNLGTSELPALRQNTWSGFSAMYSGTSMGAVDEIPQRFFDVIGGAGGSPVTTQFTIWNSGPASFSWTASDDSAWLSESSGLATLSNENTASTITLTCNPGALSPGTYTGNVTVTVGGVQRKATVLFTVCSPYINVGKQSADTSPVGVVAGVVSAVFDDCLYVQSPDRSCGIRVDKTGTGLDIGMGADVAGTVTTNADGERRIVALSAVQNGTGYVDVWPLLLTNQAIGGGDYYYNSSTGAGQKGAVGSTGLNNVGLLVRTTGQVSYVDPAGAFAYLNDGSGANDGNTLGTDGTTVPGIRVILPAGVVWPSGSYIGVTGVSTLTTVASPGARAIRVRVDEDISVLL